MHKCFKVEGNYFEEIRLWYISIFFNTVFIAPVSLCFGHTSYYFRMNEESVNLIYSMSFAIEFLFYLNPNFILKIEATYSIA